MNLRSVLAECELFAQLTPDALDALAAHATPLTLRGGARLFSTGDAPDAIYIVASGRLRVTLPDGSFLGYVARLEPMGEIGAISGETRSADVHAIRDSVLIRLGRDELLAFLLAHPTALVAMARVLIHRLRQNQLHTQRQSIRSARAFTVIAGTPEVDAAALSQSLARELAQHDSVRLLEQASVGAEWAARSQSDDDDDALIEWLSELEHQHRYLVYAGNREPDAWTQRALRQADRILVIVPADLPPQTTAMIAALKNSGVLANIELVLVPRGEANADVAGWKRITGAHAHYFAGADNQAAVARLARQITGRGIGLVFGGGGARGFAHLGLIRALNELAIPVDLVGGSSMGAFVAALLACGYSVEEMRHLARDMFVEHNLLNDYLIPPRGSLIRGRKFLHQMREIFGDRRIDDLRLPFFCVSTNLTRGVPTLHDTGSLAAWVTASMSVPGIAPPTAWQGELLVDGAVVNSLPTDLMLALDRGPIIASDVSTEGGLRVPGVEGPDTEALFNWKGPGDAPGLREILFRTATLTSESGVKRRAAMADLYLRMPVGEIGMFDWKRIDEIMERGYHFALEHLAPVREKLLK
ncbi:MAG: patatin-like phospholipase family protein [Pseudomonadota bacterium]